MNDFLLRLEAASGMLPKQQRALCEYVLNNLLEASMLTITQMAEKVDIGTATVIRTIQSLGYSGYQSFKRDLKKTAILHAGTTHSSFQDLQRTLLTQDDTAETNLSACMLSVENTLRTLNNPDFLSQIVKGVDMLLAAERIYVLGLRSSQPIAQCFEALLSDSPINIIQLSNQPEYVYDRIFEMTERDVLLAVAFHPVVKKTADIVQICHARGIPTLVLSNTQEAPVCRYGTLLISTDAADISLLSTPAIMIVELLAREIARRTALDRSNKAQQIDLALKQYGVTMWAT